MKKKRKKRKSLEEEEHRRLSEVTQRIMLYSLSHLMPLWMANLAENFEDIRNGDNVEELPKHKGEPAIVVAAGPSLWKHNHLHVLAETEWKHPIIICDRLLIPCLKEGLIPDIVANVDASPMVKDFYDDPIVDDSLEENKFSMKAVFNVCVNPDAQRRWLGERYWFLPFFDDPSKPTSLTAAFHFLTRKSMIMTGGNVGSFTWSLANYLKCNPIILVGFDMSYSEKDITKATYYKPILEMAKGDKKKAKSMFAMGEHPTYRCKYILDPYFKGYREIFRAYISTAHRLTKILTINATEGGSLFGYGMECTTLEEAIKKYA